MNNVRRPFFPASVLLVAACLGCTKSPSRSDALAKKASAPVPFTDDAAPKPEANRRELTSGKDVASAAPKSDGYTPRSGTDGFSLRESGDKSWETARTINESTARKAVAADDSLVFANLDSLSPSVARIIAGCRHGLAFYSLHSISPEVASALAQHQGGMASTGYGRADTLLLKGLRELPDQVAEAIAEHKGPLEIGSEARPIDVLSKGAAVAMGKSKSRDLTLHVATASEAAQESLALYRNGPLRAPALLEITSEALLDRLLDVPDMGPSQVSLTLGVQTLTPEMARKIVESGKGVMLPKVRHVDRETAAVLVTARNALSLYFLEGSKESLDLLRTNKQISLP